MMSSKNKDPRDKIQDFPERFAAIDIGTNTALLAILAFNRKGRFKIHEENIETPRIGHGLLKKGIITKRSTLKLLGVLVKFVNKCKKWKVKKIFCSGTETLRTAKNRREVIQIVKKRTGLKIKTLSPKEEARLSFISATEEIPERSKSKALVIDIGGGSTEQVGLDTKDKITARSTQLGSLTLKEKFEIRYPVQRKKLLEMQRFIRNMFSNNLLPGNWKCSIGTGGTITTIPSVLKRMEKYDGKRLDFHIISKTKVYNIIQSISRKSLSELHKLKGLPKKRADIFLPGLLILYELMNSQKTSKLLIRNRGIRFGLIFAYFKKQFPCCRITAS